MQIEFCDVKQRPIAQRHLVLPLWPTRVIEKWK